jgi:type IV secretion system protein VirB10
MIATDVVAARDPRLAIADEDLAQASALAAPEVGRPASAAEGMGLAIGIIVAAMIGGFTMLSLAHHHADTAAAKLIPPIVTAAPVRAASIPAPPPTPVAAAIKPPPPTTVAAPHASPVLVLDNEPPSFPGHGGVPASGASSASGSHQDGSFSPDEQFAARTGDEPVPTSHVTHLDHPAEVVAQGTIIPAVLETAINSDLPGYARALVSRDVRSFDGSKVLVPRGSRLIGQYKSALQAGQSRALVVWNRLLRPDGTSIQLGSPATDDVGETGLAGKVNSHFFQRFGSAILLSVIDGLAGAIGGSGNTVVLGSVGGSSGAAGVALQNQIKISPTVRVMQGTPIQVFAARDLDFADDGQ